MIKVFLNSVLDRWAEWRRQRRLQNLPDWLRPPAGAGQPNVYTECFDRVNLHQDIPRLCKRLEEQGAFVRDPKLKKSMEIQMAGLKKRPPVIVDYQKTGHPVRDF